MIRSGGEAATRRRSLVPMVSAVRPRTPPHCAHTAADRDAQQGGGGATSAQGVAARAGRSSVLAEQDHWKVLLAQHLAAGVLLMHLCVLLMPYMATAPLVAYEGEWEDAALGTAFSLAGLPFGFGYRAVGEHAAACAQPCSSCQHTAGIWFERAGSEPARDIVQGLNGELIPGGFRSVDCGSIYTFDPEDKQLLPSVGPVDTEEARGVDASGACGMLKAYTFIAEPVLLIGYMACCRLTSFFKTTSNAQIANCLFVATGVMLFVPIWFKTQILDEVQPLPQFQGRLRLGFAWYASVFDAFALLVAAVLMKTAPAYRARLYGLAPVAHRTTSSRV